MKLPLVVAIVSLAGTAAWAGEPMNFDFGGKKIRIDPDRGVVSIPGVYESGEKRGKSLRDNSDDAAAPTTPSQTNDAPLPTSEPRYSASPVTAPSPDSTPSASTSWQSSPPERLFGPRSRTDAPREDQPASAVAVAPAPAPTQRSLATADTPLGLWQTEEKDGRIRIEQCGSDLCGFAVTKSDQNGEKILINMKSEGSKWSGKIHDPKSGRTYDSTIAMKGSDSLRVQGCAMSGMFCGNQTWSRVN